MKEKKLGVFLMAGDPTLDASRSLLLEAAAGGADFLELGVPFSDPTADGPVIQKAAQRSLARGTTVENVLQLTASLKKDTDVPLYLLSYFNPIFNYGLEKFFRTAGEKGAAGVIIPDLPLEERTELIPLADKNQVALVPLLPPGLSGKRLTKLLQDARGFIYCVSVAGTTGERKGFSSLLKKTMEEARTITKLPLYAGFGVQNPQMACQAAAMTDGVIVGSNFVKEIPDSSSREDLLQKVREKTILYKRALLEA